MVFVSHSQVIRAGWRTRSYWYSSFVYSESLREMTKTEDKSTTSLFAQISPGFSPMMIQRLFRHRTHLWLETRTDLISRPPKSVVLISFSAEMKAADRGTEKYKTKSQCPRSKAWVRNERAARFSRDSRQLCKFFPILNKRFDVAGQTNLDEEERGMFTPLIRVHSIAKGLDFKIVFCSVFGLVARESHSYLEAFADTMMNGDVDDVL